MVIASGLALAESKPAELQILTPSSVKNQGLLLPKNWDLIFRIDVKEVEYFLDGVETGEVVYEDPDGLAPDEAPWTHPDDELGIAFSTEGPDVPGVAKVAASRCSHLVDDLATDLTADMRNKAYLLADDPPVGLPEFSLDGTALIPAGQDTGGSVLDCFGFGRDDDLPGLVVMANVGGARVFDPTENLDTGRIRNIAGFINQVGIEVLTAKSGSAITASLRVDRLFQPIVVVDYSVDGHFVAVREDGVDHLFDSRFAFVQWQDQNRFINLRAVMVEGDAPNFVDDMDGDGAFTAQDVMLAGYTLISNEAELEIVTRDLEFTSCEWFQDFWYVADLDGNGAAGNEDLDGDGINNELACEGGLETAGSGGSRGVIRIRR